MTKKKRTTLLSPQAQWQLAQDERNSAQKRRASRPLPSRSPSPDPAPDQPDEQFRPDRLPPGLSPSPDPPSRVPPSPPPTPRSPEVQGPPPPVGGGVEAILLRIEQRLGAMEGQLALLRTANAASEERAKAAEDRAAALAAKVESLASDLARADQRQESLDRAQRRSAMMFFGMAETQGQPVEELVRQHLRAVDCPAADSISEAVRLGPARAQTGPSSRPRAVRVTFSSAAAVFKVFKVCKALREQRKVFVDRDLTIQQQAARASLMGECKQLRENGYKPFWRGEKLFYGGGPGSRPTEVKSGDDLPASPRQGSVSRST